MTIKKANLADLLPPVTPGEIWMAQTLCGANCTGASLRDAILTMRKSPQNTVESKLSIAEPSQPVGYSNEAELKILKDLESELGRMAKLIGQLRAKFLSK